MVHAFIMVNTTAGKSQGLLESVRGLGSVQEAHIVAGDYDIVVEVDAGEVYDVLQTASGDVQGLEGVVDTKTYIAID
jgi:DNA-binding Lrp family transcriptional regulator